MQKYRMAMYAQTLRDILYSRYGDLSEELNKIEKYESVLKILTERARMS